MTAVSRKQKSVKNIIFGLGLSAINALVAFVIRTFLIKCIGIEVIGLNGLFTEVISVMSLAELGVGMAIVYSLYKPLHERDYDRVSQLMTLFKKAYHYIAFITFVLGVIVVPFVDKLITHVDFSLSYIRLVFFLFVLKTSVSYLFSYKISLLNADQQQYKVSIVTALTNLLFAGLIIVSLIYSHNYVLYLLILIVQTVTINVILSIYVDKHYSKLDLHKDLPKKDKKEIFANIKNIFIKRISGIITSSTDNILISKLVGTVQVGFYSNYIVIFSLVRILRTQITGGLAASIGDLSVSENPDHCIGILCRLTAYYSILATIIASGLLACAYDFISIWLGEEFTMSDYIIAIAILNIFIEICCDPLWQFLEVSGLFKQDRNIGIIGSTVNLIVSISLGLKMGIPGIFMGTVCTQTIQLVLKTLLLFKEKYQKSPMPYFSCWIKNLFLFCLLVLVQIIIIGGIDFDNHILNFLVKGIVAVLISITLSFIAYKKYYSNFIVNLKEKWNL